MVTTGIASHPAGAALGGRGSTRRVRKKRQGLGGSSSTNLKLKEGWRRPLGEQNHPPRAEIKQHDLTGQRRL